MIVVCNFAMLCLILIALQMETWTIVGILGSTVSAVVSILWGTHKIIKRAFERRDEEIRHLLLSEQEFKDHKSSTST